MKQIGQTSDFNLTLNQFWAEKKHFLLAAHSFPLGEFERRKVIRFYLTATFSGARGGKSRRNIRRGKIRKIRRYSVESGVSVRTKVFFVNENS